MMPSCTDSLSSRLLALALATLWAAAATSAQPFPARVDLGSLAADDGIVLHGEGLSSEAGWRVAFIRDVDNNGLDDVAVSAPFGDINGVNSGNVYVVLGNTSVVEPVIELADLDGSNGFTLTGIDPSDFAGYAIGGGGDVNGDGFDDFLIGAFQADPNGSKSGESYLIFGRAVWPAEIDLSALNGSDGVRFEGLESGDDSGIDVEILGDFNGDGFDDFVIGAWRGDPNGGDSGEAYVGFGQATWPAVVGLDELNGANGFTLNGIASGDQAGWAVSGAGDTNGDGLDDLVVSGHRASPNGANSGEVYLIFGSSVPMAAFLELDSLDGSNGATLRGVATGDEVGWSVESAGDVNLDGFDDLVVGAQRADPNGINSGASYVVFGRAAFPESLELASLDGTDGFQLSGVAEEDRSGYSVASAGDFNGDGFGDIAIGATFADTNGTNAGESYVIFGQPMAPEVFELSSLNGESGVTFDGPSAADESGFSVSGQGDFNGDGVDDLIVGAPNGNDRRGMAHLLFGRTPTGITLGATGGTCPGTIRLRSKGLTPGGVFGLYRGSGRGDDALPNGVCAGTPSDLADPSLISQLLADGDGRWTFTAEVNSAGACGLSLQVVDLSDCALSNRTTLPEE